MMTSSHHRASSSRFLLVLFLLCCTFIGLHHYCTVEAFPTTTTATSSSSSHLYSSPRSLFLPDSVFETIHNGGIATIDNFLTPNQIRRLRQDAQQLYQQHDDNTVFITDSIAGYGKTARQERDKQQFDPAKDRAVCPAYIPSQNDKPGPFRDETLGDATARSSICILMAQVRADLAQGLDRPGMDTPATTVVNRHEISYTRFGPGASLKRHTDEHHEELKGVGGWLKPTRRSLSWLIYLNEPDWNAARDGGMLRTFPRRNTPPSHPVGARRGDLQIGWLTETRQDPVERPVFLDGRRNGESGNCALYMDAPNDNNQRLYLTQNFKADPYLFLSTDWVIQHVLIENPQLGHRFHYVQPPKSVLTEYWDKYHQLYNNNHNDERILDVPPTGGTLVMFDSVALPHQVMPTVERERWALSGWFHEAQQEIPPRQKQQLFLS